MHYLLLLTLVLTSTLTRSQSISDTMPVSRDSALRIVNLNTNFIQHIDSTYVYAFQVNREPGSYFWYLKNEPVGLSINKENGTILFKAAKNYFQLGKMKYDLPYKVNIGVQSLFDAEDRLDTSFNISFYNTEIIPSTLKLSVAGTLVIEEGEEISFRIQCETGSFPFENILFNSTLPIRNYSTVKRCNDEFRWKPDFDFVKDTDAGKEKAVVLSFIASTRFQARDTTSVRIVVRNALNYVQAKEEFDLVNKNIRTYILQLKSAFLQLDRRLKKTKSMRTGFDLTSAGTALTGTILNSSSNPSTQKTGRIMPSVGVALVPVKEATSPNKTIEQNQAAQTRAAIKRLEYLLTDNVLIGEKDMDILRKTSKLKDELKQAQIELIDVPVEMPGTLSEGELNEYFNSKKVNRKYRLRK